MSVGFVACRTGALVDTFSFSGVSADFPPQYSASGKCVPGGAFLLTSETDHG
jgi:hypothetical protein